MGLSNTFLNSSGIVATTLLLQQHYSSIQESTATQQASKAVEYDEKISS